MLHSTLYYSRCTHIVTMYLQAVLDFRIICYFAHFLILNFKNIFIDDEINCFCADRSCTTNHNLQFKALLNLDNSPGHTKFPQHLYQEAIVVFFSSCLIYPMDQTVIATFKRYYMKTIMTKYLKATDSENRSKLSVFWMNYNILHAVNNIEDSWPEIEEFTTMIPENNYVRNWWVIL